MTVRNHRIPPEFDVQLAMIEGTPVTAYCGISFTPHVQVGTSGRATAPGAPTCERCLTAEDLHERWSRLADQRDDIEHEMDMLNAQHRALQVQWREERETAPRSVEVVA